MSSNSTVEQRDTSVLKSSLLAFSNKGQEIWLGQNNRFCLQQSITAPVPLENMTRKFYAFLLFTYSPVCILYVAAEELTKYIAQALWLNVFRGRQQRA